MSEGEADLPQFVAAISGDLSGVRAFLAGGGSATCVDKWSETMLHKAALNNQLAILELLLAEGGTVNQHNECLQTPLHYACISGGVASARCLLEKGADVNARDKFQQAPLHCACIYGHVEVARLVLDAGADINAVDQHLMAPLHYSCANGHLDIVQLAVSAGADMNIADQDGKTPLHTACNWGELRIIQLLVNSGASTDAVDKAGRRPLQCLDPDTFTELKDMANETCASGTSCATTSGVATSVVAVATPGSLVPASEIQAFGLIEKSLARQQMEVEALRAKTAADQGRLEQTQQRQGWMLDQEVAERERQGQQIVGVAQQLNRFETILKKTAFLHKEVAEQQNRAILQLQAATQHKAGHLLDAQAALEERVEAERGHNAANRERIDKLWEDNAKASTASNQHKEQLASLRDSLNDRDALLLRQQQAIDKILLQSSEAAVKAAQAEEKSRADAIAMATMMQEKFDKQEKSYQQQEAAQREIISKLAERVTAMDDRKHEAATSAASADQHSHMEAKLKGAAAERDGLVFLTNKYYDMLSKQQVMLEKLTEDMSRKDDMMLEQRAMINKLSSDIEHITSNSGSDTATSSAATGLSSGSTVAAPRPPPMAFAIAAPRRKLAGSSQHKTSPDAAAAAVDSAAAAAAAKEALTVSSLSADAAAAAAAATTTASSTSATASTTDSDSEHKCMHTEAAAQQLHDAVKELVCQGVEAADADLQTEALAATVALASVTRQKLAEHDIMEVAEQAAKDEVVRERAVSSMSISAGSSSSSTVASTHRSPSPFKAPTSGDKKRSHDSLQDPAAAAAATDSSSGGGGLKTSSAASDEDPSKKARR